MKRNQAIPFDERVKGQAVPNGVKPPNAPPVKKRQAAAFDERVRGQAAQGGADPLDILSMPCPVFFQGMAALTGLRCQRENLECSLRWHEELKREANQKKTTASLVFGILMLWGASDLYVYKNPAGLFHFLLEPMYWLEKTVNLQEGD